METCPVCWNSAQASALHAPEGGLRAAKLFDCEICGRYEITDHQAVNGKSLEANERYLLSAITRTATEEGRQRVVLTTTTTPELLNTNWPSATQQATLFLAYLDRKAKTRGDAAPVNHKTDYPLFFAKGREEVDFIARELINAGYIKRTDVSALPHYAMTMKGYEELERRRAKPTMPEPPSRPPDAVTGLPGKGAFETDFPRFVAQAEKTRQPLAFLMIDADHFKKVNDKHGHAKGDEVLRELAQRIHAAVSSKGTAYRWGGEEIAALLPNHSLNEALAVGERIRVSIAASPMAEVAVTVSVGVAVLPDHATDGASLFKAADAAVYDAKDRGRDCVRFHGEPEPRPDEPPKPHVPPRKQPSPDQLPDGWIEAARLAHFRGEIVRCPNDEAILSAQETSGFGEAGGVFFRCKRCGLEVNVEGPAVQKRQRT